MTFSDGLANARLRQWKDSVSFEQDAENAFVGVCHLCGVAPEVVAGYLDILAASRGYASVTESNSDCRSLSQSSGTSSILFAGDESSPATVLRTFTETVSENPGPSICRYRLR